MTVEAFLGEIRMFAGGYAPNGWMSCDGRLLSVSEYTELFSIIKNQFGGDGMTNFALPDYRGRVPLSAGSGKGLTPRAVGQMGGSESAAVTGNPGDAGTKGISAEKDGQAVSIMQPWLCTNFIICVNGIYPSRS